MLFERHEHGVVFHPVFVFAAERVHLAHLNHGFLCADKGAVQNRQARLCQQLIIYAIRIVSGIGIAQILFAEQPHILERIQINKIRIACGRGKALIRAVAEAGLSER